MGRLRQDFSLSRRKKKSATIWYYQSYDKLTGKRTNARSTGIKTCEVKSKTRAKEYCQKLLAEGRLIPQQKARDLTLKEYIEAEKWLNYTENVYIRDKTERKQYGKKYYLEFKRYTEKYILPRFGEIRLTSINETEVKKWILSIDKSRSFKNNVIKTFRVLTKQACEQGYTDRDTLRALKQYNRTREDREQEARGVLSQAEVNELFFSGNIKKYWGSHPMAYGAACVAAETGMRQGEVLALRPADIRMIKGQSCIIVKHSWDKVTRSLKGTKSGDTRIVPLRSFIYDFIVNLTRDEGFIFRKRGDRPLAQSYLNGCFYGALEKMGIDRQGRRIVFHSLRHTANSFLINQGIPEGKVRATIGHESAVMTENYHHLLAEDLHDIREVREKLNQCDLNTVW